MGGALYAARGSKKSCKSESDFASFKSSSEVNYQQLDELKADKKKYKVREEDTESDISS